MDVRCFLIIENVAHRDDGAVDVLGVHYAARGTEFPLINETLRTFLVIDASDRDPAGILDATIRLRNPSGGVQIYTLAPMSFGRRIANEAESPPRRIQNVTTLGGLNFPTPGVYWAELIIDNVVVAQTPFVVATFDSPDLDPRGTTPEERDRLAAQAETYLRDQKNLERLSAQNVFLSSTEGGIILKLIRSDGSVAQARFEPLDWAERFRENPGGLAREINRVLQSESGTGIRSTVADKRYVFLRLERFSYQSGANL
jgi:hypothetical protein